jgi:molybdopterin converting factor small subunit
MPVITVHLPATLTSPHPARAVTCEATTVGEALLAVAAREPPYEQRIFYAERLLVGVALNGRHLAPAAVKAAPLADGDRVDVVPPVAGG